MASKKIMVFIDEKEIETTLRRIKKREFKEMVISTTSKIDDILALMENNDIVSALANVIESNIDFICEKFIEPFIELTKEEIDEMDIVDIIEILKEILNYNKIDLLKIKNFFQPTEAMQQMIQNLNFNGKSIPSLK